MSDIFISYSRKDIAYARLLHKALNEHDLETWIDWQDIPPSIEWMKEIYTAIEEANTIIFILSIRHWRRSTGSFPVQRMSCNQP